MSTHTITLGGEEYALRPLTADAALRLLDMAAESAEDLQAVMDRANSWRRQYAEDNAVPVTLESFDDPEVAKQLEAAGYTRERVEAAGVIKLPIDPSETEMFAAILPGAYRSLRDPILNACAVLLAPSVEIMDAEDAGELDEYYASWRRKIREEATPEELAELIWVVWEQAREQLLGGAVGKIMGRFQGVISPEAPAPKKTSPARPKPKSSTRSRARTAGSAEQSS